MLPIVPRPRTAAGLILVATLVVTGCQGQQDTRLAADHKSCTDMGHSPASAAFNQCLIELNERRCAEITARITASGQPRPRHYTTIDCTKL